MARIPYTIDTFPVTLDANAVNALPVAKIKEGWHVGSPGMGCFLDAPGFPSYYLQPVYDARGNTPRGAPGAVLRGTDGAYHVVDTLRGRDALLRSLYLPLPVDHPRVQAWIGEVARHMAHCYADVERPEYGRPGTLIFPVPAYKLRTFRDDPRWNDEYRAAARAEIEAYNKQEIEHAVRVATLDNHRAVLTIRKIYPDWTPGSVEALEGLASEKPACWWETADEKPSPETCPGDRSINRPHTAAHCQWCGI